MSRLGPLDRVLVLLGVPFFAVCFGLTVRALLADTATPAVLVAPDESGLLAVSTLPPGFETELRSGDRLLRLGETDLRGAGRLAFRAAVASEASGGRDAEVLFERDGVTRTAPLPVFRRSTFAPPQIPLAAAFFVTALVLIFRAPRSPAARALFGSCLCLAFALSSTFVGELRVVVLSFVVQAVSTTLLLPLTLRAVALFPHGRDASGPWFRAGIWLFALYGPSTVGRNFGIPSIGPPGILLGLVLGAGFFPVLLAMLTRTYRRADPLERRQLRWVLLGAWCSFLPPILGSPFLFYPPLAWIFWWTIVSLAFIPLSLLFALAFYNLFDVDRLISATASYNVLMVIGLGVGFAVVPTAGDALASSLGLGTTVGRIALAVALASIVVPAHQRLRPRLERIFFKERHALDHGIAELLQTLSSCADARELTERAGAGLHRLFRPEACVVYAGAGESYAPIFVEGRAVPPAFEAASPLIGTLRGRRTPLALDPAGRRPEETSLGPFDRAALETLDAEVVVPVRQGDGLAAFVCLGPKRSGDVYTSTDLSHLAAVAQTVSHRLQHFDQEVVIREGREMQESLRRYVPGAVARQLSSGVEPTSGEADVSVLFVDIRGYTTLSEGRRAEEIFSTVNRYTEAVSEIVERHGGSVVEFNGDGMMAVFGAPRELDRKERAAVEAGCEIVAAVEALPVDGPGDATALSVGVGIATGEAFVGSIQAVDRMIWSAIGNTTNLAARLQGLTRELAADLVIDAATWERGRPFAADFQKRPAVPIRGRRERQDLYVLATGLP